VPRRRPLVESPWQERYEEIYPKPIAKAHALAESHERNHPPAGPKAVRAGRRAPTASPPHEQLAGS